MGGQVHLNTSWRGGPPDWITKMFSAEKHLINQRFICMVVEYSSTANTHPEGVRLVVLKTPPE
jgi:hypothetical protein